MLRVEIWEKGYIYDLVVFEVICRSIVAASRGKLLKFTEMSAVRKKIKECEKKAVKGSALIIRMFTDEDKVVELPLVRF